MKSPANQRPHDEARDETDRFIEEHHRSKPLTQPTGAPAPVEAGSEN